MAQQPELDREALITGATIGDWEEARIVEAWKLTEACGFVKCFVSDTSLMVPEGVTSIEDGTFKDCMSLVSNPNPNPNLNPICLFQGLHVPRLRRLP